MPKGIYERGRANPLSNGVDDRAIIVAAIAQLERVGDAKARGRIAKLQAELVLLDDVTANRAKIQAQIVADREEGKRLFAAIEKRQSDPDQYRRDEYAAYRRAYRARLKASRPAKDNRPAWREGAAKARAVRDAKLAARDIAEFGRILTPRERRCASERRRYLARHGGTIDEARGLAIQAGLARSRENQNSV